MESEKVISALFAFLVAVFWRWVSALDKRSSKLEEKIEVLEKNSLTKTEIKEEIREVKDLIKDLQRQLNKQAIYKELSK